MAIEDLSRPSGAGRPIAVLAALREERIYLERLLQGRRRIRTEEGTHLAGEISGRPAVILETGIGARRARAGAERIVRAAAPRAILAAGFAGGLQDDLRPGDIVLAREVFDPPPPEGEGPRVWEIDEDLLRRVRTAAGEGQRIFEGRIAAAKAVLTASAAKRSFGERHGALAVDMESSGFARAANARSVPIIHARAVVDEAGLDLPPDFGRIIADEGRVKPLRLAAAILARPSTLLILVRMGKRARAAGIALARFAAAAIPALWEGTKP